LLKGAEQLDHISKVNSFSGNRDLTKLSWGGTGFHGFGELSHSIAGRDGVDFGGVKPWNQEAISYVVVVVSVVILWRGESPLL
jgi:hypothetical protein